MSTWEYFLSASAMIFGSVGFWTFIQHMLERKSNNKKILLGLTYLAIKVNCNTILERGYVTTEELEDLEKYLYEPYKAQGGNGMAEELMKRVKQLPNRPVNSEGGYACD